MQFILNIIKFIKNPKIFTAGADIEKVAVINNESHIMFYKKFKKNKLEQYTKTLFLLNYLKDLSFIPKLVKQNDKNLELYLSYCGEILTIETLPTDWKNQFNIMKKELIKKEVIFIDWGLWDVNPFVLNNVCIRDNKLYLIDFGDCSFSNKKEIDKYFDFQIQNIEKMVLGSRMFIFYHYTKGIYNMIYRKLTRIYNIIMLLLLVKIIYY
jgi:hypothetical protein